MKPRVVLFDPVRGNWLRFESPCRILTTRRMADVLPILRRVEAAVEQEGLHAAGFLSYEAAPALDPSLPSNGACGFPLLWFGLFRQVKEQDKLARKDAEAELPAHWRPSVTADAYMRALRAIRRHIREGDAYQVNYTYRLRAKAAGATPWDFFYQMSGAGDLPFAAFLDTGEWAICSASPELFLRLDGERIESRPMKGTAARGRWAEDDLARGEKLRASAKDRAENVMIVDMVRNDLGRVAEPGSVQVQNLFDVERHPTVWQMTSTVCALTRASLTQILQATFPPASITGAPKRRAMEIIARLEHSPRRVYTGTIGFISPGRRAQFNVAIRTVSIHRDSGKAEYGVGGGIVWDSKPAAEQRECQIKTRALHPLRRDFDLLETMLWTPQKGYWLFDCHVRRLTQSAAYFGFLVDSAKIRAELKRLAAELPDRAHRIRLTLARQGSFQCDKKILQPAARQFGDVTFAASPVEAGNVFLYHKTTCRQVYVDAVKAVPGCSDVLLYNEKGEVTESTIANVAFEIRGRLFTPPVPCGLLPGTQRAWLIGQGKLQERVITRAQALRATGVYLLNSLRGMQKIRIVS